MLAHVGAGFLTVEVLTEHLDAVAAGIEAVVYRAVADLEDLSIQPPPGTRSERPSAGRSDALVCNLL